MASSNWINGQKLTANSLSFFPKKLRKSGNVLIMHYEVSISARHIYLPFYSTIEKFKEERDWLQSR